MSKRKTTKNPPAVPVKSIQYDLFSQFVTNDQSQISNTVDIWESIPKYFFTRHQVEKLRTDTGHADPFKWDYSTQGIPCAIKIQPALIEQSEGGYKAFFPGVSEELVEEALKKIFADQNYGIHDPDNIESWVKFTLSMIQKELSARGRSRSITEIKHTIEVMSSCILTFYKDGKEVWKGSILQDLVTVGRDDYQADSNAHHVARLPLFISHSINSLEFRQFNYERFMGCNGQLTRWIYKRLINRYKQASMLNDYHFMLTDLQCSGLLQQARARDNKSKVVDALDELVAQSVLNKYDYDERKKGRAIVDVKYTLYPTSDFIQEQKAANKRMTEIKNHAVNKGLPSLVDN